MNFQNVYGASFAGSARRAAFFPRKPDRRNADNFLLGLEVLFLFFIVLQFQRACVTLDRTAWAVDLLSRPFTSLAAAASFFCARRRVDACFTFTSGVFDTALTGNCLAGTSATTVVNGSCRDSGEGRVEQLT